MVTLPPAAKAGCHHGKHTKETRKMTYQIRPLFQQILHTLGKPLSAYDTNFPIQIKTVTAVNTQRPHHQAFVGMAILPGRINVLLRPKVFVVETTALVGDIPLTTYNVVVMDAAGDLRLVEEIRASTDSLDDLSRLILQVSDLLDEQAAHNSNPPVGNAQTLVTLRTAARQIAQHPHQLWPGWITYILEELEAHTEPVAYGRMLAKLGLAIEIWSLEGKW